MMRFIAAVLAWIGLFVLGVFIASCTSDDAKYLECVARDRTSRPCQ